MWKGKDQTTIYLNFSLIHRGPKNGQTVTRPLIEPVLLEKKVGKVYCINEN